MKLNPNAVVPTLVHDGLMPREPYLRAKVRLVNKLVDEYVHNSCTILTFATAFRPWFAGASASEIEARLAKSPSRKRTEYKVDVALHGLDSKFAAEAVQYHEKLLDLIEASGGAWLAGGEFSLADIAVIPYVLRLDLLRMSRWWERRPNVASWYKQAWARPSVRKEILDRMTAEDHAPFQKLKDAPDPWPKIQASLS